MTASTRTLRWRTAASDEAALGLEHVELKVAETGISAEGVVVAGAGATAFGARWRITVDPDWTAFRSLHFTRLGGATVALRHDGYGEWTDGEGKKRKEFAGLSDCLVEGSPFGLVALLARLGAKAAKTQSLDVVFLAVPSLDLARASIVLKPLEPGRRFALTRAGETVEIDVDADGLVTRWGDGLAAVDLAG